MDSLNDIIKNAEKLLNQARTVKCDNEQLNVLRDNAFKDLDEAKAKLKKTLEDVDNIK